MDQRGNMTQRHTSAYTLPLFIFLAFESMDGIKLKKVHILPSFLLPFGFDSRHNDNIVSVHDMIISNLIPAAYPYPCESFDNENVEIRHVAILCSRGAVILSTLRGIA